MHVSEQAVTVIRAVVSGSDMPEGSGLRISIGEHAGSQALKLGLIEGPTSSDQVVEDGGARVFVDEPAADRLAGRVLDATVVDGDILFTVS